ncbi:hypothetical protein IAT40_007082 [Kwoniella sp. CBS 6097]
MATQPPMMHPNHNHNNTYTHRPHNHTQSSPAVGVGAGGGVGVGSLYDDPTAWHSPSPYAVTPSSLPNVPLNNAGTSLSPVDMKQEQEQERLGSASLLKDGQILLGGGVTAAGNNEKDYQS